MLLRASMIRAEGWNERSTYSRAWESAYRRRWQHDRVVRSTHGVNCTGCVQSSTRYPGGVALRFARVKRYRPDKGAAETDTIDDLRTLLSGS